jgi:hypothetical protein
MDEHALTLGVGAFKSALYLVATARSFKEILLLRGQTPGDFVVPVPQDLRKRGGFGPVFANHVSFLFYRISAHDLSDLKKSVSNLLGQMREMMRLGIQKSYVQFMRLCRRFPLSFYGKFLQSPTKGKMASFYFSDTGTSLEGFEGFMNLPILDAAHFPPNTVPPGVTTIFSRFKGRLGVTVAFSEAALSLEEYESFALALRQTLLGEKRNDE